MIQILIALVVPAVMLVGFLLYLENKELFSKEDWEGEEDFNG